MIDNEGQLDINKLCNDKIIGVTAGASAPEDTVQTLIKYLISKGAHLSDKELTFKQEDVTFSLPKSLRR